MPKHWLTQAVTKGNPEAVKAAGADAPDISLKVPMIEAWRMACEMYDLTEEQLAEYVAAYFRLELADLTLANPLAAKLIPEKPARESLVFPLREDNRRIFVATANPANLAAEQTVAFISGRHPIFEIAPPQAILDAIDDRYAPTRAVEILLDKVDEEVADAVRVIQDLGPSDVTHQDLESTPIVKLTSMILKHAVGERASDIHIEPSGREGAVRFRVDGVLTEYLRIPLIALDRVVSRIKVLSGLDIADRLRPQDGSTRVEIAGRQYDLRVSTVPTRDTEKAVIRILDPEGAKPLNDIGLPPRELAMVKRLISHRNGIVIVSGPTGSGKTTTLYGVLQELATGEVNVMTVEDPIEYNLQRITQIQVGAKRGVTFASALRAILRQDPNVILVGEIRDEETADVAVQAAMTGHLVLTTLHTNDAVGCIARMTEIGVNRASLATTLRGAMAQRLLRRVCPYCVEKIEGDLTAEELKLAKRYGEPPTTRAVGCNKCSQSGYRGRFAILEVMEMSPQLEELIIKKATPGQIERAAIARGMQTLVQVGLAHVRAGESTLHELDRVVGESVKDKSEDGQHILVVDDEAVTRQIARTILERMGYKVTEADDGYTALEHIRNDDRYSLVLMDLEMPRIGGSEALSEIRKTPETAHLPVIVLTSNEDPQSEVDLMTEGADDYIRKPIEPDRFLARVKATLRRSGY